MTFSFARSARASTYATLALAVAAAGSACRAKIDEAQASPGEVAADVQRDTAVLSAEAVKLAGLRIEPATTRPWQEGWTVPARLVLDPQSSSALGSIVEGRVTRVLVRVGDHVRAGQVLVAVHSHEMLDATSALAKATAASTEAETALQLAERNTARAERLYGLKAVALADVERAQGALAAARAMHAVGQAELSRAREFHEHLVGSGAADADAHEALIRAPIDGVIVGVTARPGEVVLVGAPLVSVSRADALLLQLQLAERALAAARPGAFVRFTVPAYGQERFEARVARVAPTLDSTTRTAGVQAIVTNGRGRLRAEMFATAELLGLDGAAVLVVPSAAVQSFEGDTVVVSARPLGEGLELEALRVRAGRHTSEWTEILAGLTPGTPIVVDGAAIAKAEILRRRGGE